MSGAADPFGATACRMLDRGRQMFSSLAGRASQAVQGPTIPLAYSHEHPIMFPLAAFTLVKGLTSAPLASTAAAVTGMVGMSNLTQREFPVQDVALNAQRVLEHREWNRLVSSTVVHATSTQLLTTCAEIYSAAAHLERRWGPKTLLGLISIVAAAEKFIYRKFHAFKTLIFEF